MRYMLKRQLGSTTSFFKTDLNNESLQTEGKETDKQD